MGLRCSSKKERTISRWVDLVITIQGLCWPDDVGNKHVHALKHVKSLEWAIARCTQHRTAVQAGGNVGLWPKRLAESFQRVLTFEPDDVSRQCLKANVPVNVKVYRDALGQDNFTCGLERESLGSHRIVPQGSDRWMTTVDSFKIDDLDFLQLDVEGYEWHALKGAEQTLARCKPLVQVELRDFTLKYGKSDDEVRAFLSSLGYREVSQQPGNDFVFEVAG